jgi:hypothetical protein
MRISHWFFLGCLVLGILPAKAQLNNEAFFSETRDTLATGEFGVYLDHLNFTRNNEYFNKITDGYTLFGFHLIPSVRYQIASGLQLESGVFLWKDYGAKGFQMVEPVLTFRYTTGNHRILMGTLEGGLQHRLIEPLYEFENQLNRRLEYGLQWKYQKPGISCDAWIDWRTMIYPRSDKQEEVLGGLHLERELKLGTKFRSTLSFQGTAYHKGGQIDTIDKPLITWFHGAPGGSVEYLHSPSGFLRSLALQAYAVGFLDYSFFDAFDYKKTLSPYLNLSIGTKLGMLMFSYWESPGFPSYQGGRLYRTVSSSQHTVGYQEKSRQLLLIRIMSDFRIGPDVWITSRIEPYYDLRNKIWEFNHGFYINYRGKIWKSKKQIL